MEYLTSENEEGEKTTEVTVRAEFSLEEFFIGRSSPDVYSVFFSCFMPCVGRKTYWKHIVASASKDEHVATVSNEAFALLILENNWERWMEFYASSGGRVESLKGKKKPVSITKKLPKYTRGGIYHKEKQQLDGEVGRGWTSEGIRRFNEIYDNVKKDRRMFPGFINDWLVEERQRLGKRSFDIEKREFVAPRARHDLYSDSEEDDNNSRKKQKQANNLPKDSVKEHLARLDPGVLSDNE